MRTILASSTGHIAIHKLLVGILTVFGWPLAAASRPSCLQGCHRMYPCKLQASRPPRGMQRPASRTVDEFCLCYVGLAVGPDAASVFTTRPVSLALSLSSPLFRVLLRRLRLPLPLTSARCRCRQLHDLLPTSAQPPTAPPAMTSPQAA